MTAESPYVELHAHSAYSFLDAASEPEELLSRASELGYDTLALTDHDNVCGGLVFAHAARAAGIRPISGCEVSCADAHGSFHVTLLVESRGGWSNLCRLLTLAHAGTRDVRGGALPPLLAFSDLLEHAEGLVCLTGCPRHGALSAPLAEERADVAAERGRRLAEAFPGRVHVELSRPRLRGDRLRLRAEVALARSLGLPVIATNDVHAHDRSRGALQDALVAIRVGRSLDACEAERRGNREHVLKGPAEMAAIFADLPEAISETRVVAERCTFDLTRDLGYQPPARTADPDRELAALCRGRFAERFPADSSHLAEAERRLHEELSLIRHHRLSGFFLLHIEVLEIAREVALEIRGADSPRMLLPPGRGRGSSVGSIVCYLVGLSHVDPVHANLSLGRFLNRELASVPDIDLDFPRDIREQLILRVHERFGSGHAALVGAFATYRARGAIRELGKALGLPPADITRLAAASDGWSAVAVGEEMQRIPSLRSRAGDLRFRALAHLARQIAGLPRHLSQHPGGMIISDRLLSELVPLQPAAMAGRTICQWDKDSVSDAGFLKIDLLGLGMLTAVEECVLEIARTSGERVDLSRVPLDDPGVYEEIQAADTVGVFQIESRAQMQMLLRTQPRCLDDLVVEVALVRPGPIQGGAVHPYIERLLARRDDPDFPIPYDHPLLAEPLAETLGVIVFQDQVLSVAQALAGFSAGQAESLRRAMSRRRSRTALEAQWRAFRDGSTSRGVPEHTAALVFEKILAFSAFGFPKAHAAAFGLLAYQSAWLRRHHPAAFLCALLNAQPMGFYPPATLVRDAEHRGVRILPVSLARSAVQCHLEPLDDRELAVRVGLASISGLGEGQAAEIVRERTEGAPYRSVRELATRLDISLDALSQLVRSGACDELGERRRLLWELGLAIRSRPAGGGRQLVLDLEVGDAPPLPEPSEWELIVSDYATTGLTTREHPIALIRRRLHGVVSSRELPTTPTGTRVALPGLAVARQQPQSANGIVFLLLEDEHGLVNLIVFPSIYQEHRLLVRTEPLLLAEGTLERRNRNINVIVETLSPLDTPSRPTVHRNVDRDDVPSLQDLRAVAPGAMNFGQGRRR